MKIKKQSNSKEVLTIIFMIFVVGFVFASGCKTSGSAQITIPIPYDSEGNQPK